MGTWGSAGVWHEERQRYRCREVDYDGYVTGLGKWLVENAPDVESALAAIEHGVVGPDTDGPSWRGGPTWKEHARYEFRDGRWWGELPDEEAPIPLRILLAFEDKTAHARLVPLLARVDDELAGAPVPVEAPPTVDVPNALAAMHDENERLRHALYEAAETLGRCAGVGGEARSRGDAIRELLGVV